MLILIMLLVFSLFTLAFLNKNNPRIVDSLVYASVSCALYILISVELLSINGNLDLGTLACAWFALALFLLAYLGFRKEGILVVRGSQLRLDLQGLGVNEVVFVFFILLLVLATGILAWLAPPNTFDSMTYHMSRVMHWIQNQSVDFYPTSILRQLFSAPWAEYAILHTVILSGTDRFANFVQWSCMVGSIAVIVGVARELGSSRYGQVFAALFCATLPMGILQSTSTQNDYVVGFWLVCCVFQLLKFRRTRRVFDGVFLGLALGLAMLTKPTAYVFALPFLVWIVFETFYKEGVARMLRLLACLTLACVVNMGHFYRNYEFSGTPLGQTLDSGDYSYENAIFTPAVLASNILRNVGLHLQTDTKFDRISQRIIERAHHWLGISISDKRTTWPEYEFRVQGKKHHEDYAGNLWQVVLIFGCIFLYVSCIKKKALITLYILALVAAFLLFCALLRWQPWHSRLHLPMFLLWAPVIGVCIGSFRGVKLKDLVSVRLPWVERKFPVIGRGIDLAQQIKLCSLAGLTLMMASLPPLYSSETKPSVGEGSIFFSSRASQLFYVAPHIAESYIEASELIVKAGCSKIGLVGFGNDWEYPIWALTKKEDGTKVEIRHITAPIISPTGKSLAESGVDSNFSPCAVISPATVPESSLMINGRRYQQVLLTNAIKLFQ